LHSSGEIQAARCPVFGAIFGHYDQTAQTLARWSFGWPLALVAGLLPRVGTIESGSDVANSSGEPSNLDQTADFAIDSMVVVGLIDERG